MAKKKGMSWYDYLAILLLIVGGINWGLVGIFEFNLVSFIFGVSMLANIVYTAVGVSGVYTALWLLGVFK